MVRVLITAGVNQCKISRPFHCSPIPSLDLTNFGNTEYQYIKAMESVFKAEPKFKNGCYLHENTHFFYLDFDNFLLSSGNKY